MKRKFQADGYLLNIKFSLTSSTTGTLFLPDVFNTAESCSIFPKNQDIKDNQYDNGHEIKHEENLALPIRHDMIDWPWL